MRWDYSRANFRSAKKSLRQAIALDPLNARARRELAWLAALDLLTASMRRQCHRMRFWSRQPRRARAEVGKMQR